MRDKLIEILKYRRHLETSELADYLLENGAVVEVVRCKDCVHYCGFENCKNGICDLDSVRKRAVYPDDFCSYGVRKGGESDA